MLPTIRPSLSIPILLFALGMQTVTAVNAQVRIGSRRELFVDDHLIERMKAIEFRLHRPVARELVWKQSNQTSGKWWGGSNRSVCVFQDGNLYKMYYRDYAKVDQPWIIKNGFGDEDIACCYAESKDGIHWERKPINRYRTKTLKVNNIVWAGTGATNFAVFKDANPQCKPAARYKAIGRVMFQANKDPDPPKRDRTGYKWLPRFGLLAFQSLDGIRWSPMQTKRIIKKGEFDSHNVAFWDATRKRYVSYIRIWQPNEARIRAVATLTSADFLNWSDPPKWLKYKRASKRLGTLPVKLTHLYDNNIMSYYRAPHFILGFPMRLIDGRVRVRNNPLAKETAINDTGFMSSRDGVHFRRWREAFMRPGPSNGRWWNENNCIAWGMVETKSHIAGAPNEISFYANEHYASPRSNLRRYTLRLDGFVSLHADETGEVVTKPLTFTGKQLSMNFATSGIGSVRVELQDASGKAIPGFTLKDCRETFGDSINERVRWKGGSNVAPLAGKKIRIRFVMQDADLWSIRFH